MEQSGLKWFKIPKMINFIGTYTCILDSKGRISLPSKFRKALAKEGNNMLFLLPGDNEGSIFVFSASEWQRICEMILSLPKTEESADLRALAGGKSFDVEIDKQGRINLPRILLEEKKMNRELVLVGSLNKIVIWDRECYKNYLKRALPVYERMAKIYL